jgi:hypothetical protein
MQPNELTQAELAKILNDADVIEAWLKNVRDYALRILQDGKPIPGWKVAPKKGTRKWKDERMVKQRLASEGLTGFMEEKLSSPTQIDKLAKKQGVQLDLFDLITTESSGVKIVRETDAAASATASAEIDFAD